MEQEAAAIEEDRCEKEQQRNRKDHDGGEGDESPEEQRKRHAHLAGSPATGASGAARADEGREEAAAVVSVHFLRVPLHADLPS